MYFAEEFEKCTNSKLENCNRKSQVMPFFFFRRELGILSWAGQTFFTTKFSY